jgi:hypothetical protein
LELDHVFVCTPDREQALQALTAAGLDRGPSRVHHGQGTANDCFYFENAYLELLWMKDESEIRSPAVGPLCLWERIHWRESGASPFGLAFRPLAGFDLAKLDAWRYEAAYLPRGQAITVLSPAGAADEALVFLAMSSLPPSQYPDDRRAHLVHKGRPRRITRVRHPRGEAGKAADPWAPGSDGGIGARHMVLELDGGHGEVCDLRPALPLTIHW